VVKRAVLISLVVALTLPLAAAGAPPSASTSVVGGRAAQAQAWPSIAFLLAAWDVTGDGVPDDGAGCTGTVVKPGWILSAAHCAYRPDGEPIDAMLSITGAADINDPVGEAIVADRLVVHPSWDPVSFHGDAMLVHLQAPSSRPPMPLARPGGTYHSDPAVPDVAGWGNVDERSTITTDVLQEAYIEILDDEDCAGFAAGFDEATQTCAGSYQVAGVCHGDSGGPLTRLDAGGVPHLFGLTSYGPQPDLGLLPCDLRAPAVFTRVPAFAGWIDAATAGGDGPAPPQPPAQPPGGEVAGGDPPALAPPADRTPPVLRGVRLSARRFTAARRGPTIARRAGAMLTFRLSEAAAVRISVLKRGRALAPAATLAAPQGRTTRRFTGRLAHRALPPGRYRLRIGAVDTAGNRARPVTLGFRVVR
jgi:secreted trypsin-like serine protease